jgi:hypothetical protein
LISSEIEEEEVLEDGEDGKHAEPEGDHHDGTPPPVTEDDCV